MNKFVEFLQKKCYALATTELSHQANTFGFRREVREIVLEMQETCIPEAENWSIAFITAVAKKVHPDGRCEKSVRTANMLLDAGLGFDDEDSGIAREVHVGQLHPTVMQQMAQVAFCFIEQIGLIDVQEDHSWWTMPLI